MKALLLFLTGVAAALIIFADWSRDDVGAGPLPPLLAVRGDQEGVFYRKGGGEHYLLDIDVPEERSPSLRPVFVWIHGGGWFKGSREDSTTRFKARTLNRAGFIFVSVDYRLAPDLEGPGALQPGRVRFPLPHQDAARALVWISHHISAWGGDPSRIVLAGDSAGGQIAALLTTRPELLRAMARGARIRGALLLDAVGLDPSRMMTREYRLEGEPGFQRMMFNAFGTRSEERKSPRWDLASPLRYADRGDPRFFFVVPWSAPDRFRDARIMAARLGQSISKSSWRVPADHVEVVPLLGNPNNDMGVTAPALRFLKRTAGG